MMLNPNRHHNRVAGAIKTLPAQPVATPASLVIPEHLCQDCWVPVNPGDTFCPPCKCNAAKRGKLGFGKK